MIQVKRLVTAATLAGVFGLTLFATSSSASGPLMLGPVRAPIAAPKAVVSPATHSVMVQQQLLAGYRQVRSFWLSRAIVR
jgi:hypothetical protein